MSEGRVPAALKRHVEARAAGHCEYCRSPASVSRQPFSVEHIIPKARGGTSTEENLALAYHLGGRDAEKMAAIAKIRELGGTPDPQLESAAQ